MKTILMNRFRWDAEVIKMVLLFAVLIVGWPSAQRLVLSMDVTAGYVDTGILVLVVLALLCFLVLVGLSWWLLQRFWVMKALPGFWYMVLQFRDLDLWQQFVFYFACYALLLLAGVGCLIAVL